MTGRHADASVKSALRNVVWLLAPVAALALLVALGLGAYFFFTRSFLVIFSVLWVVESGLLVRTLTRPGRRYSFFAWFMPGSLIGTSYQIIAALAHQHIWLTDRPHVAALIGDWTKGIVLAFIVPSIVVGIRSGELLFWRSDPSDTETDE